MPIAPVSPSPLTPMAISFRLASVAPVPTDGMRPWTELNPCDPPRKYAGLLLEQPIPESLITFLGSMPMSKNASMMRSEMALWPQPAQSVVLPPRYGCSSRPILFVLTSAILFPTHGNALGHFGLARRCRLESFLHENVVRNRPRVDRQPVVVQHAPQTDDQLGR